MRKFLAVVLSMLGMGVTTACNQGFSDVDVAGFAALLDSTDVVVLDVRTPEEYGEGHINGALHADVLQDDFLERAKQQLPAGKTVAVYCRSGKRSARAATMLAKEGYRVVNLKGGIMAWTAQGMPVSQ